MQATIRLIYDDSFGYWMKVDIGHVIEVREGHSIFLRSNNVEICRGLEEYLATFQKSTPIFYGSLCVSASIFTNLSTPGK